jgi:glutamate formiminotransferase
VVEMIRREADRYGVAVIESELIGLIPNEALVEAAKFYLQLGALSSDQILENRLADLIQQR